MTSDSQTTIVEEDTTDELEAERRVDNLLDAEERLREQFDSNPPDRTISISPSEHLSNLRDRAAAEHPPEFIDAPILDAEIHEFNTFTDEITFTCEPKPGETAVFSLDIPESQSDHNNHLLRLCRHHDTSITRIADLPSLPVVKDQNGQWRLRIPPTTHPESVTFNVEDRTLLSRPSKPSLTDRILTYNHTVTRKLTETIPLYTVRVDESGDATCDTRSGTSTAAHFGLPAVIVLLIGILLPTFTAILPALLTTLTIIGMLIIPLVFSIPFLIEDQTAEYLTEDDV